MASCEDKFNTALKSKVEAGETRNIHTRENYYELVSKLKKNQNAEKKTTTDYYHLKRYDIFNVGGFERLITKVNENDGSNFKIFVFLEEIYGVLEKAHKETGHGGRDRMIKHLQSGYANISRDCIELYLSLCENCNMKKRHVSKGVVVKPILSKDFNSRGQVDLMDFQSNPDDRYKFIMVYQDHLTKIFAVCNLTPETKHWMPTREAWVKHFLPLAPANLTIRFSAPMVDQAAPASWPTTSTVVTSGATCPAPTQDNECKDCRACWDPAVKNVAYGQH